MNSEPSEEVHLNINFNINAINIVSEKISQKLNRRSLLEWEGESESSDKLRMYMQRTTPKKLRRPKCDPILEHQDHRRLILTEPKRKPATSSELGHHKIAKIHRELRRIVFKKEPEV